MSLQEGDLTDQECLLLAQIVQERKEIVRGKYSTVLGRHAWEEIVQTINVAFPQIQFYDFNKKWENLLAKARVDIKQQKRQTVKGEGLSLEQFSAVTQIVISVMNLSDMLQQDYSVFEQMETQQNRTLHNITGANGFTH
ncbi:uncharacterized protein PAE49_000355 [Odontesthes bonariensis]